MTGLSRPQYDIETNNKYFLQVATGYYLNKVILYV